MGALEYFVAVVFIYCVIFFFDRFFKSCAHYPYIQFLNGTGLEIGIFRLCWKTTAFNRTIVKIGTKYPRFFNMWFGIGLYITLILFPISIVLLLTAITQLFLLPSDSSGQVKRTLVIEPIVPGATVPIDEVGYYVITLAISSLVHELGHAIASVKEDLQITDVGMQFLFIFPITFVNLSPERLMSLNVWRKLRVLCAGVWHNLVTAVIAYFLFYTLPVWVKPFYTTGEGVYITDIDNNSPLAGMRGLFKHDVITELNDYRIESDSRWLQFIHRSLIDKPGYCVETDFVLPLDESVMVRHEKDGTIQCCSEENTQSLCFEYFETSEGFLDILPHMCLPARKIIENVQHLCYAETVWKCPKDTHCIKPIFHNSTILLNIKRANNNNNVIYIGHPRDLYRTVKVSSFIPKYNFLSSNLIDRIELLLKYIVVFSLGLVIMNVIPCWYLDGQHITSALVQLLFTSRVKSKLVRDVISLSLTVLGTFFIVLVVVAALWKQLII